MIEFHEKNVTDDDDDDDFDDNLDWLIEASDENIQQVICLFMLF